MKMIFIGAHVKAGIKYNRGFIFQMSFHGNCKDFITRLSIMVTTIPGSVTTSLSEAKKSPGNDDYMCVQGAKIGTAHVQMQSSLNISVITEQL